MSVSRLPWFRLYVEMIDDEKIRLLAFEDRWHYVAILCCKGAGILDTDDAAPLLRRKLCVKLGLAARELEAMADRLAELGLIDPVTFQPAGWDGRQFISDTDPTAAERKRRQRERDRVKQQPSDVSRVTVTNVTRTDTDTEEDSKAEDQKHSAQPSASRFEDFWSVYPKKVGKKPALTKWQARKLDAVADRLIHDVLTRASSDDGWLRGYVPDPCTYLNQDRWEDDLRTAPVARAGPAAQPGKQMQGLMALEEMKRGLVRNRNSDGSAETGVLLLGKDAGR